MSKPIKLTNDQLLRKAMGIKKGGFISFALKSNATKFGNILKALGYKPQGFRSSGPTVDKPRQTTSNAYSISW